MIRSPVLSFAHEGNSTGLSLLTDDLKAALRLAAPSWPLQATVAVNPFWNQRDEQAEKIFCELPPVLHEELLPEMHECLAEFSCGQISREAVEHARVDLEHADFPLPNSLEEFLRQSEEILEGGKLPQSRQCEDVLCLADVLRFVSGRRAVEVVVEEVGKAAAAYWDTRQAMCRLTAALPFWEWWLELQKADRSLQMRGIKKFGSLVSRLSACTPEEALEHVLAGLGIENSLGRTAYLKRLFSTVLGWSSVWSLEEWKQKLDPRSVQDTGYDDRGSERDLLTVRAVYELALFEAAMGDSGPEIFGEAVQEHVGRWRETFSRLPQTASCPSQTDLAQRDRRLRVVWQRAREYQHQFALASVLTKSSGLASRENESVQADLVFCIDVRSEILRRHVERTNPRLRTRGFAGFFGLPIRHLARGASEPAHLHPVLLASQFQSEESLSSQGETGHLQDEHRLVFSYLKCLRKGSFSSFLFVELFGVISVELLLRSAWLRLRSQMSGVRWPQRFVRRMPILSGLSAENSREEKEELAVAGARILRQVGLTHAFPPLVLFVGHGSESTNNAFSSALDCGACGGNSGDVNARVVAQLLNDRDIRRILSSQHEIAIPESTFFAAGVHETVSDQVSLFETPAWPRGMRQLLQELKTSLSAATLAAHQERLFSRGGGSSTRRTLDEDPTRRKLNWSEIRPEWGLAGNECFFIAPRSRTAGLNLESRAFLHEYDWRTDRDFVVLEQIMTAPLLVTNWINMQYYASSMAPMRFGAGDKTLHNIVNESGVYEGNEGDLRVGLPLQSVWDGPVRIHEGLRLSVYIEAPRHAVERIIAKHSVVRELIDNHWIHLLRIESSGEQTRILLRKSAEKEQELPFSCGTTGENA